MKDNNLVISYRAIHTSQTPHFISYSAIRTSQTPHFISDFLFQMRKNHAKASDFFFLKNQVARPIRGCDMRFTNFFGRKLFEHVRPISMESLAWFPLVLLHTY
jgi:hypothetical protein